MYLQLYRIWKHRNFIPNFKQTTIGRVLLRAISAFCYGFFFGLCLDLKLTIKKRKYNYLPILSVAKFYLLLCSTWIPQLSGILFLTGNTQANHWRRRRICGRLSRLYQSTLLLYLYSSNLFLRNVRLEIYSILKKKASSELYVG